MALDIKLPERSSLKPQITLFGVGGAGGNATNNMIMKNLEGVNFVVANTDAQALENSVAEVKIQLGVETTKGLGAGAIPGVGAVSAEEAISSIYEHLQSSNMVFVTAGMGGGTGTGAAPVIAKAASEMDILTVGVVTKPFNFEGPRRMRIAEEGIKELQKYVDTLIIIPNQNLFRVSNENTTFADAFIMADEVLYSGVRSITDLMVMPGLINLDFADVRSVMKEMGKAMMGTGESGGDNRALLAAEEAISNPLLDNISMNGAKGVLINITGGQDMTLFEVDEAANRIREEVDEGANIIFGSAFDEKLNGKIRVSVVATGIGESSKSEHIKNISINTNSNLGAEVEPLQSSFAERAPIISNSKEQVRAKDFLRNNDIEENSSEDSGAEESSFSDTYNSNNYVDSSLDKNSIESITLNKEIFESENRSLFENKPLEPLEYYQGGFSVNGNSSEFCNISLNQEDSASKTVVKDFARKDMVESTEDSVSNVFDEAEGNKKQKKSEGFFDIPAFLRRKVND